MKKLLMAWDFNGVLNRFGAAAAGPLEQLQAHGADHIVVSSSMPGTIEQYLRAHGLDGLFTQVYGFDVEHLQWVGDPAVHKEGALNRHAKKFGPYEHTAVIGDSESDIRAGIEVGAETFLIVDGSPGFETKANHVVSSLEEVVELVLQEQKGKTGG